MKATACLLNWKRRDNLIKIVDACKNQGCAVFLWNNNPEENYNFKVDWQVNSSVNRFCIPRWWMASLAQTEYVFSLDDDLIFKNDNVISQCIEFIKDLPNDTILGKGGVKLNNELDYFKSKSTKNGIEIKDLDIIKGRFLFTRTSLVRQATLEHNFVRGDDIFISSFSKNKIVPNFLQNSFEELPDLGVGLKKQKQHKERQAVVEKYFKD
jgi:hypothetical protein